jgi:hypothetical protein
MISPMEEIGRIIGFEHRLDEVNGVLRRYAAGFAAPVVGALHVTCADETEWECGDSFQRTFVNALLPDLKFAEKAPLRLSNLGGRYEPGALAVAEHHFAAPEARQEFKLVKVNAHVAVSGSGPTAEYGRFKRYDTESTACGALHALLAGPPLPFVAELRAAFAADGYDRTAVLLDDRRVAPAHRPLLAALVHARLQARRVEEDIARHKPAGPTVYLVAAAVTLNRAGAPDSEVLCALSVADCRSGVRPPARLGLGDDPARYRIGHSAGRLHVTEA